jgi:hypothetical protein
MKHVFLWDQWFSYGAAIISGILCLCGCSGSFTELLLSQDNVLVCDELLMYESTLCRKHVFVWQQRFIFGASVIS